MTYHTMIFAVVFLGVLGFSYGLWLVAPITSYTVVANQIALETSTDDSTDPSSVIPLAPVASTLITNRKATETKLTTQTPIHIDEGDRPEQDTVIEPKTIADPSTVPGEDDIRQVPFYSQFTDISDPNWKKVGCGIAGLAMLIDFHKPAVPVDTLLEEGIAAGAYLDSAGWTYAGLIGVSKKYGMTGATHDFGGSSMDTAFSQLKKALEDGPVMASVYYTFTPGHPIPHLVILNSLKGDTIYYNDPAEPSGSGTISIAKFKSAWKKRYIEFWPIT